MKLKEKMFVRTKLNDFCNMVAIRKIDEFDDDGNFWIDDYIIDAYGDEQNKLNKEDIEKASENIIDLIEKGDYVNGYKVLFADKDLADTVNIKCINNSEERVSFYEEDIKDVLTKEQFDSMKYVVERDTNENI